MKKNQLSYKDYIGSVEWSEDDNLFYGKVLGINELLSYQGKDIDKLRKNFEKCIDQYLKDCISKGIKPRKSYKGSFNVRVGSVLHKKAVERANQDNTTLNDVVVKAIENYLK